MAELKIIQNLQCPVRDAVMLCCTVYRPDDNVPYPAILMRTPYLREKFADEWLYSGYRELALSGYNVVIQDVRGAGDSQGVLLSNTGNEVQDGYDTVEWVGSQEWCDGNVGTYGLSYFGLTQMAAAEGRPHHLKCMCPFQNSALHPLSVTKPMTLGNFHLMWLYGRVLDRLDRGTLSEAEKTEIRENIAYYKEHWDEVMFRLPIRDTQAARIPNVPLLMDFIDLVDGFEEDTYWQQAHRPIHLSNINVPMFHLTGWFDGARDDTFDNYAEIMQNGDAKVKETSRLVIGPWLHGGMLDAQIDGVDFGAENSGKGYGVDKMMAEWFDLYLKGISTRGYPPVSLFVLGENKWRSEQEWPLARTEYRKLYLQSGTDKASGLLVEDVPAQDEPQHYVYDPDAPQPSSFKDDSGRTIFADPAALECREDVLVYRSSPLEADMEVTGCVKLALFAATTAVDTDFFCRLSDTAPDESSFPLLRGIVRARFRNGRTPELVEPEKVYEYTIELGNISNLFRQGHRLRIDLSSSSYPEHNRNLNTGERTGWGKYAKTAKQTIFHDSSCPSHLILPVIPR